MSLGDFIYTILSENATVAGLVSTKIKPGTLPQGTGLPGITYETISTSPTNSTDQSSLDFVSVQITTLATTQSAASTISEAIRDVLDYCGLQTKGGVTVQNVSMTSQAEAVDTGSGQDGIYLVYQTYLFSVNR